MTVYPPKSKLLALHIVEEANIINAEIYKKGIDFDDFQFYDVRKIQCHIKEKEFSLT